MAIMIDNRDSLRGIAQLAQAFAEKRKQEERASLRNQAMQAIMGAADAYRAAVDTPYAQKYGADDLMGYAGAMDERRQQEEKARQQAAQREQMQAFANKMRDPSYNYRDARTVIPSLIEYAAMGGDLDALSPNLRHWVEHFAIDRVDLGDRQQIVNTDPMTGESKISYDQKKGLAPARPSTGGGGGKGKPVLRTINGELVQVFPDGTVVPIYGEKKQPAEGRVTQEQSKALTAAGAFDRILSEAGEIPQELSVEEKARRARDIGNELAAQGYELQAQGFGNAQAATPANVPTNPAPQKAPNTPSNAQGQTEEIFRRVKNALESGQKTKEEILADAAATGRQEIIDAVNAAFSQLAGSIR